MKLKVYCGTDWKNEQMELFRSLVHEDVTLCFREECDDFDILILGRPDEKLLQRSSKLKYLIIPWAGLPSSTADLMGIHPEISVHNIHHNASSAGELALGLMIAAARLMVPADRALRKGDWSWRYRQEVCLLISGSRVLILGYGHLGRTVGRACHTLGAEVFGIRRSLKEPARTDQATIFPPSHLHSLLKDSDFVVLALPLTEDTECIIGDEELELMHGRSVLVNVGRGRLVDQEALYSHLKRGSIGAAGIDVWYSYPSSKEERSCTFPSEEPLWELDNVVMTPHMGGAFGSEELENRRVRHLAKSINRAAKGEELPFRVHLEKGY
ncbi:MAG: hydroxyacid dehydrogenase [Candidatus Aegiribacteria sp.]|nr:hydroxyacid dehydrogenase [Candidatus Aegiribacteria sp.]MBD3295458.1 hydroxyacid dehydrogenase [Candidatus Fermentibacteria bacterium]